MKVGLVYDHEQRPETTGFYCRRALGKLVDVEHLVPHELRSSIHRPLICSFLSTTDWTTTFPSNVGLGLPGRLIPTSTWREAWSDLVTPSFCLQPSKTVRWHFSRLQTGSYTGCRWRVTQMSIIPCRRKRNVLTLGSLETPSVLIDSDYSVFLRHDTPAAGLAKRCSKTCAECTHAAGLDSTAVSQTT